VIVVAKHGPRVEEFRMMSESAKRVYLRRMVSPHLEVLRQISLLLTKDGLDATRLAHETVEEAYRSPDESIPEENCSLWLFRILTRRFLNGI
jgi:DNA-directed RNA polymerase specialized sigma24 family protein